MVTLSAVKAEMLLNEHFDRALGTLSASSWSSGSTFPNDSNWHTYSPGSVQFQVVSQQLQYTDYCSATTGKAVEYTSNHSRDHIQFKNGTFAGTDGDKLYMAFLMYVTKGSTYSFLKSSNANGDMIMSFLINATEAPAAMHGRVLMKTIDNNTYTLGVSRRGEATQFADINMKTGSTYLVVAEYGFVDGTKNDLIKLYINPSPSTTEASATSVNPSSAADDTNQLAGVALCSNGKTPENPFTEEHYSAMLIDEVRVATTWDEIWENNSLSSPSITVNSSLSFGKVGKGVDAQKTIEVKGSNLNGGISVASDNPVLVPSVTSISKDEAEAGYTLTLTLTATKIGEGKANLTFKSNGASDNIVVVSWNADAPVPAAGTELLENGSFETHVCKSEGCEFEGWTVPIGFAAVEETEKTDGETALLVNPTLATTLSQGINLSDEDFAAGTLFNVVINYKVLYLQSSSQLVLDCYWQAAGGGDADAIRAHDADKMQRAIASAASSEWEQVAFTTSKPAKSSAYYVYIKIPKNAQVLFDAFSVKQDTGGGTGNDNTAAKLGGSKKIIRNGQLIIIRDGKEYNILGVENR